jgi:hypothetical protein
MQLCSQQDAAAAAAAVTTRKMKNCLSTGTKKRNSVFASNSPHPTYSSFLAAFSAAADVPDGKPQQPVHRRVQGRMGGRGTNKHPPMPKFNSPDPPNKLLIMLHSCPHVVPSSTANSKLELFGGCRGPPSALSLATAKEGTCKLPPPTSIFLFFSFPFFLMLVKEIQF